MPKKGYKLTEEHKSRIRAKLLGRKQTQETKEKISLTLRGTHSKEETKVKMRAREELKKKLFQALQTHLTNEHPDVLRNEFKGHCKWMMCPVCGKDLNA